MKVLVVSKKTDYEFDESVYRAKLKGIYESRNVSLEEKLKRHEEHYSFVERVLSFFEKKNVDYVFIPRESHSAIDFEEKYDFIITVGGDGIFMDVAGYILDNTPILGVASSNSYGAHCSIKENIENYLDKLLEGKYVVEERTRIKVEVSGFVDYAVNDVYIGSGHPASFSRLRLIKDNDVLKTGGSGLLFSTFYGKTGWYDNVALVDENKILETDFSEDEKNIVRYKAINPKYGFVYGVLGSSVKIFSDSRDSDVVVVDGDFKRRSYNLFNGNSAIISVSDKSLYVVKFE